MPIGFTGFADGDFDDGIHTSWRQRLRSELLTVLSRHVGLGDDWRLHASRAQGGLYLDRGKHDESVPGFWLGLDTREFWFRFRITRQAAEAESVSEAWQRFLVELRKPSSAVQQHIISSLQLGYFVELYNEDSRLLAVLGPGANSRALLTALDAYPQKTVLHLYITRRWPRGVAIDRGALIVADLIETVACLRPLHEWTWVAPAGEPPGARLRRARSPQVSP